MDAGDRLNPGLVDAVQDPVKGEAGQGRTGRSAGRAAPGSSAVGRLGRVCCGLGLLGLVASAGCFFRPGTVARRFAGEFRCPEQSTKVEKVDDDRFRASGCNRRALYRCTGEYGELCQRIGQPETINPSPEESAPPKGGELPALPQEP